MSFVTGSIIPLFKIKFKSRCDSYTDQFNRVFMVKVALISCLILGVNWLKDTIGCIVPDTAGIDGSFVKQACWIQGLYIYKELKKVTGKLQYYGLPTKLEENGMYSGGELCTVSSENPTCIPMTKTFYLQYQYFPFFMGVIALLYYLPYIYYRFVNGDLMSLKVNIKAVDVDVDEIIKNYFNYQINPRSRMKLRLVGNVIGKLLYVIVNIIAFVGTDNLLNNDFKGYGSAFLNWTKKDNAVEYDYTATRTIFKAGEFLLPTYGICEVLELGKDIKHSLYNKHRFVCEISQNVLYQYCLMLLWFLFIFGILISCVGLVMQLVDHAATTTMFLLQGDRAKRVYHALTLRECQYLEYIRKKNIAIYHELVKKLKAQRLDVLVDSSDEDNPVDV